MRLPIIPPKRRFETETDSSRSAKRRTVALRPRAPRADVRPLNRVLRDREQQRQSQDNRSPAAGPLTPELMQLTASQPDPSNPNRALRRTDRTPLTPKLIPNPSDFNSSSSPASPNCSPAHRVPPPLPTQILQEDVRANRHHTNYRGEVAYDLLASITEVIPPPSSSRAPVPMASQMAPIGATSNIARWQQEETAIDARNNSDLSGAFTNAQMLVIPSQSNTHIVAACV